MQLSAFADPGTGTWGVAVDGRWIGAEPDTVADSAPTVDFDPFDLDGIDSARLVAVWLDNGEVFHLTALRPTHAKGQDRDLITVALPADQTLSVFDPRLSTEYSAAGMPRRFGVELWLGEDPDGDQHPLRLAGEADPKADPEAEFKSGSGSGSGSAPLTEGQLTVHPMRAHSAGVTGIGLYLLVR